MSTILLLLGVGTSRCLAQDPALEDLSFNLNGIFDDAGNDGGAAINAIPGATLDLSGLAVDASSNLTGLGVIQLTYDPGVGGTYFFDVLSQIEVGSPGYNEYMSKGGTLAAGESYEAGFVPGCTQTTTGFCAGGSLGDANTPASQVYTDVGAATATGLANTNTLPFAGSDYLEGSCTTEPGCNGWGVVALGESFTLTASQEEILYFNVSYTAPAAGTFYVEQTNPDDGLNGGAATEVYYTMTTSPETVCTQNCGTTSPIPEPSSWLLVATGLGAAMTRLRRRFSFKAGGTFLGMIAAALLVAVPVAKAQTVLTVPWVPGTAAPHTAYSGGTIVLGAVFIPASGHASDSYTYQWSFGDGLGTTSPKAITNFNDISATYIYTVANGGGAPVVGVTSWSALVTVSDTTTTTQYTGTYPVIWEDVNTLSSRVNVAIDWGLWNLHQSMYHPSATTGNWSDGCASGYAYNCGVAWTSLTATDVQALEVNGHQSVANGGSAADPYASDVAEALDYLFQWLNVSTVPATTAKAYHVDPAASTFGCSDGSAPTTTLTGSFPSLSAGPYPVPYNSGVQGYCGSGATMVFYNPNATTCAGGSCNYTFKSNPDGYAYYVTRNVGDDAGYEQGMIIDAIVASQNPAGVVPATNLAGTANPAGVAGETYGKIVEGFTDYINYCQYGYNSDVQQGAARGNGGSAAGGGWLYSCNGGDDNSTSQWESIGLISAERGFSVPLPPIVKDENQVWTTNAETAGIPGSGGVGPDTQANSYQGNSSGGRSELDDNGVEQYEMEGSFGYRGNQYYSPEWGPWAVTPSGMVQMSLNGTGRTKNTTFGDASTSFDQRFNTVETFYADNFCNTVSSGPYVSPLAYTYGMFSFTKSMLLHDPGGVLSPIQFLRSMTPNVFGAGVSQIDWYNAIGTGHYGGTAACDGVAQTLVGRQYVPQNNGSAYATAIPGFWWAEDVSGDQYYYETAWSLIMLNRTVFVNCVNNLGGAGTKGNALNPAKIDLSWSGIPNVTGYNILVSTTNGGPYTQVTYSGGTTTQTSFSDRTGLTNGVKYYFVLQPVNNTGAVCQSNQATIAVP